MDLKYYYIKDYKLYSLTLISFHVNEHVYLIGALLWIIRYNIFANLLLRIVKIK